MTEACSQLLASFQASYSGSIVHVLYDVSDGQKAMNNEANDDSKDGDDDKAVADNEAVENSSGRSRELS